MKLLLFEFKKMIRTKTALYFFLLTLLFIGGIFARNMMQQDMIPVKKSESFSEFASQVSMQNSTDRQTLADDPSPEVEDRLKIGLSLYAKLNELLAAIEKGEWQDELTLENDVYTEAISYQTARGRFYLSKVDMEDIIRTNNQLLLHKLPKEDFDLSTQPPIFMKQVISHVFSPTGFIVLLLLFGTAITKEFEDRTIQFVFTLPVPKWRYVLTKFSSLLFIGLFWIFVVLGAAYVLPAIFVESNENAFNYPILLETGEFLNASAFIKQTALFGIGTVVFSIAALLLIGYLFRNTIIAYIVLLTVFAGGWIATLNGMDVWGNPFTYMTAHTAVLAHPTYFPGGMIVLLGISMLLVLIGLWSNQKRGIN